MKIIITILAAIVIIDALIVYSCCVVAGRADDVAGFNPHAPSGRERSVRNDNSRSFRS